MWPRQRALPTDAANILGLAGRASRVPPDSCEHHGQRKRGRLQVDTFERDRPPAPPDAQSWVVSDDARGRLHVRALRRIRDDQVVECQNAGHEPLRRKRWRPGDQ